MVFKNRNAKIFNKILQIPVITPLNERCTLQEGYPTRRTGYPLREVGSSTSGMQQM